MFSLFRAGKGAFPLLNLRALDAWFQEQPANNLVKLQEAATALLKALPTFDKPPDQSRLEAVFSLDERLSDLRTTLAAQYVASSRAHTSLEGRLWSACYDLVCAFTAAYEFLLKDASRHISERRWEQCLPALLGRLIFYRGLDAKFRLFRHESWIPARWHELHVNYALACSRNAEAVAMPLVNVEASNKGVTIEQQYLHILLLHLINTGNVRPFQIEWMSMQLPAFSRDLTLTMTAKTREGFCVDLASSAGLMRRHEPMQGGQYLYLDTTVLHTRMQQQAFAIKDQLETAMGDRRRNLEEQLDALNKLTSNYSPTFKPFARSSDREQQETGGRVVFGFKPICKLLAEIEEEKTQEAKASESYSYSETAAMYVYGFVNDEVSKRREREKRLFAPPARLYGEPAQTLDRSATGCRLLVAANLLGPSDLGALVAMREDEEQPWALGIVRRIRKTSADQIEVGVQTIAPAIARVNLRSQRQSKDTLAGYSVNGVHAVAHGQRVDGLALEPMAGAERAGMTVIMPSAEYRSAQQMTLQDGPESFNILLRQSVERHSEWTWATADVLGGALDE
jgi:hypothetical protein